MRTVRANVRLLATDSGGRRSAIRSGYLPNVLVGDDQFADARVDLVDCDHLMPGDSCVADLTFAHAELVADRLRVGATFDLTEGGRKVGEATITGI